MSETGYQKMKTKTSEENDGESYSVVKEEIYKAVYNDVMKEVRQNLSQMKPQLVQEIVEEVISEVEEQYGKRLKKLERKLSEKSGTVKEGPKAPPVSKTAAKIDVTKIYCPYRVGEWIYYRNSEDGGCLYKVRKDGSYNTQLTDYSVSYSFSVSGGYLYCTDTRNYREHKIKLD